MQPTMTSRTIAILAVDGENYEVSGHFEGQKRKASWYTVTRSSDRSVSVDKLDQFPTHDSLRTLMN